MYVKQKEYFLNITPYSLLIAHSFAFFCCWLALGNNTLFTRATYLLHNTTPFADGYNIHIVILDIGIRWQHSVDQYFGNLYSIHVPILEEFQSVIETLQSFVNH